MYDPKNAKEAAQLPQDKVLDGEVIKIEDGTVKDFVQNTENWKGDINQPAINLHVSVKAGDGLLVLEQVFTYTEAQGKTCFAPRSNLGKYKKKYGKLPEALDKVKITTDSDGFGRIKLD